MKRVFLAMVVALTMVLGLVPVASADEGWCDVDPVLVVITPGGAIVPVFVTSSAPSAVYLPQLLLAQLSYTVQPANGGTATLVTVSDRVPRTLLGQSFPTRAVVSSGPLGTLQIYGQASGTSGSAMSTQFVLPIK